MGTLVNVNDPVVQTLATALSSEDQTLVYARQQLDQAQVAYDLAVRRYAAVRDMVTMRFGISPYALSPDTIAGITFVSEGRFRFVHMSPGDAAWELLDESGHAMSLDEIVEGLKKGGLGFADSRSVNAALIRRGGIGRDDDGKHFIVEEEVGVEELEPEDIPFE